jgi:hypothetical protein
MLRSQLPIKQITKQAALKSSALLGILTLTGSPAWAGIFPLGSNVSFKNVLDSAFPQTSSPQQLSQRGDVIVDPVPRSPVPAPVPPAPTPIPGTAGSPRFACQPINGAFTVVYMPESQGGRAYPWAVPRQLGGGWSEERRCTEISRRLELYRPDGLTELQVGRQNGYDTLCVTTQANQECRLVLTVPPGQDPLTTRDRVFDNLIVAEDGRATQGVNTFVGSQDSLGSLLNLGKRKRSRSANLNLRPFLSPEDGGTGTQLRRR